MCRSIFGIFNAALALTAVMFFSLPVKASAAEEKIIVSYDTMRDILKENSQDLSDATETHDTNLKNYTEMLAELEDARDLMILEEKKYEDSDDEDDKELYAEYSMNRAQLSSSIERIEKQIQKLAGKSGMKSVSETTDSIEYMCRALYDSYNTARESAMAAQANCEALAARLALTEKKAAQGMATAVEQKEAENEYAAAQSMAQSLNSQRDDLYFDLLSTLGIWEDRENVETEDIPDFDLSCIEAIDTEEDLEKAVNNASAVQNIRHTDAGTYTEIADKAKKESEAVGNARANAESAYSSLLAAADEYSAAALAWESAKGSYSLTEKKLAAGIISSAEALSAKYDYYTAMSKRSSALASLWESYTDYCQLVLGN